MTDKMTNRHLTNMDSGEVFSGKFCLFPNDFQLETIMKIMKVNWVWSIRHKRLRKGINYCGI